MGSMLITCPETAHVEEIGYESHPLGVLITSCTRFYPAADLDCGRTCAKRLDRRCPSNADLLDAPVTDVEDSTLVSIRL